MNNIKENKKIEEKQKQHFKDHSIFFITKIITEKDIASLLEVLEETLNDYDIEEGVHVYLDEEHNAKILSLFYEWNQKTKIISIEALLQDK